MFAREFLRAIPNPVARLGGKAFRAYSRSPGAPNGRVVFRPARQKIAGILAVLQDFLTQQGGKIPVQAACWKILNRLL